MRVRHRRECIAQFHQQGFDCAFLFQAVLQGAGRVKCDLAQRFGSGRQQRQQFFQLRLDDLAYVTGEIGHTFGLVRIRYI